jgi:hypothetical protein
MLCGCVTTDDRDAGLTRAIPVKPCKDIGGPVALPKVKPTDDARGAFIKDDAALMTANERLHKHQSCLDDLARAYRAQPK